MTAARAGAAMLASLLTAAALGCLGPERSASESGEAGEADAPAAVQEPAGPFTTFPAGGVPGWTRERERGVGVIHLEPGPRLAGRIEDTLFARAEPDAAARTLARLVLDTTHVFRFEAREGLLDAPGALEFGYEEIGLPILERGSGGWERVYLGTAADGSEVSGWARFEAGRVAITLWEEMLPGLPLFFVVPPDSIRFHAAPGGPEESFAVQPDEYILWPLETRAEWMRVRAVTPSDYCFEPAAPRQDTLWIRWRTAAGRPRVWFFTRGC